YFLAQKNRPKSAPNCCGLPVDDRRDFDLRGSVAQLLLGPLAAEQRPNEHGGAVDERDREQGQQHQAGNRQHLDLVIGSAAPGPELKLRLLTEGPGKPGRPVAEIVRSLVHGEAMEPLAGAEALSRYIEAKRLE